jgi:hypothetical protein
MRCRLRAAHGVGHSRDSPVLFDGVLDRRLFQDVGSELARPVEEHGVEVGAAYVIGVRVLGALDELEAPRDLPVSPQQGAAGLLLETPRFEPVDRAQFFHGSHKARDKGLSDVVSRKAFTLQDKNIAAFLGKERRQRRASRPTAYDYDIEVAGHPVRIGWHLPVLPIYSCRP